MWKKIRRARSHEVIMTFDLTCTYITTCWVVKTEEKKSANIYHFICHGEKREWPINQYWEGWVTWIFFRLLIKFQNWRKSGRTFSTWSKFFSSILIYQDQVKPKRVIILQLSVAKYISRTITTTTIKWWTKCVLKTVGELSGNSLTAPGWLETGGLI